jgi:hypothetical protein
MMQAKYTKRTVLLLKLTAGYTNQQEQGTSVPKAPAARWFLAKLFFYHEDGGDIFLRNVGSHTDYTALYPRR